MLNNDYHDCSVLSEITHLQMVSHMSLYKWRALFQNALSAIPKIDVAMPLPSLEIIFWKRVLHKYEHIYIYIYIYIYYTHMWKTLYQSTIFEIGIGIASSFSGMTLKAFWKRAPHIHIHTHIYIYIYIYIYWSVKYLANRMSIPYTILTLTTTDFHKSVIFQAITSTNVH